MVSGTSGFIQKIFPMGFTESESVSQSNPPGSSVHGILQARIKEWVAILFSGGSSQPRDGTWVSYIAGIFFTV